MPKSVPEAPQQTTMLEPPTAAREFGVVQEVAPGSFAPVPLKEENGDTFVESAELTPEDSAIRALDCFALENRNRMRTAKVVSKIASLWSSGDDVSSYVRPYEREKEELDSNFISIRCDAKAHFANAVGIPTEIAMLDAPERPSGKLPKVVAKDPEQQAELDARYRAFRQLYAGTTDRNIRRRDDARKKKQPVFIPGNPDIPQMGTETAKVVSMIQDPESLSADIETGQQLIHDALLAFGVRNQSIHNNSLDYDERHGLRVPPRQEQLPVKRQDEAIGKYIGRLSRDEMYEFALRCFTQATGLVALRRSGVVAPDELDELEDTMWTEFLKYAKTETEVGPIRKNYKDNLLKSIKTQRAIKESGQMTLNMANL